MNPYLIVNDVKALTRQEEFDALPVEYIGIERDGFLPLIATRSGALSDMSKLQPKAGQGDVEWTFGVPFDRPENAVLLLSVTFPNPPFKPRRILTKFDLSDELQYATLRLAAEIGWIGLIEATLVGDPSKFGPVLPVDASDLGDILDLYDEVATGVNTGVLARIRWQLQQELERELEAIRDEAMDA